MNCLSFACWHEAISLEELSFFQVIAAFDKFPLDLCIAESLRSPTGETSWGEGMGALEWEICFLDLFHLIGGWKRVLECTHARMCTEITRCLILFFLSFFFTWNEAALSASPYTTKALWVWQVTFRKDICFYWNVFRSQFAIGSQYIKNIEIWELRLFP